MAQGESEYSDGAASPASQRAGGSSGPGGAMHGLLGAALVATDRLPRESMASESELAGHDAVPPLSMRQLWTSLEHDGPNHLGLWLIRRRRRWRPGRTHSARSCGPPHRRDDATLSCLPACHLFGRAYVCGDGGRPAVTQLKRQHAGGVDRADRLFSAACMRRFSAKRQRVGRADRVGRLFSAACMRRSAAMAGDLPWVERLMQVRHTAEVVITGTKR